MSTLVEGRRQLDTAALETKVKAMYRDVALDPAGDFHFEMGRALAERLGYAPSALDAIPAASIDSFAGVGYYFDLAALRPGESVEGGGGGRVTGVDMTDEQLAKAERLRAQARFGQVAYRKAYIQDTGLESGSCDAVISNGVINLAPDKASVFREATRLLKRGGRLALADIVTQAQLPDGIACDATLWAACIGGAMQEDEYRAAIEAAGLRVRARRENTQYRFLSKNAQGAAARYGVKSVSLVAFKE